MNLYIYIVHIIRIACNLSLLMFQDETRHDENKMQKQQNYDFRDGGTKRKSETKLLDAIEVCFCSFYGHYIMTSKYPKDR